MPCLGMCGSRQQGKSENFLTRLIMMNFTLVHGSSRTSPERPSGELKSLLGLKGDLQHKTLKAQQGGKDVHIYQQGINQSAIFLLTDGIYPPCAS